MLDASSPPKVSVIITTYQHAAYIAECLTSVENLSYPNFDVTVLDDGSPDGTGEVAQRFANESGLPIKVITQKNTGQVAANAQKLVDITDGSYVVFMSGDDMFGPVFPLQKIIDRFHTESSLEFVIPRQLMLNDDLLGATGSIYGPDFVQGLRSGNPEEMFQRHLYRQSGMIFLQGMVIRRELITSVGGFDTTLTADDYALVLRLFNETRQRQHRFWFHEGALWVYRMHADNVHKQKRRQMRLIFDVVAEYIPEEYWDDFDFLVMNAPEPTFEDFQQTQALVAEIFGEENRDRLTRRLAEITLAHAQDIGDVDLLCAFRKAEHVSETLRYRAKRSYRYAKFRQSLNRLLS